MHSTDSEAAILDELRSLLPSMVSLAPGSEITVDTQLLQDGVLDSLGVLQLAEKIEERLGIKVTDEDFTPENFETVGSVVRFVARARGR